MSLIYPGHTAYRFQIIQRFSCMFQFVDCKEGLIEIPSSVMISLLDSIFHQNRCASLKATGSDLTAVCGVGGFLIYASSPL